MEKKDSKTAKAEAQSKVYEIGYLLVPSIAEEQVAGEVQTIKSLLEKFGAEFIAEDFPKLRPLAYTMIKPVNAEKKRFDKGYFGWIKFEMETNSVSEIKTELDKNASILRYILINTVRENTLVGQKMVFSKAPEASDEEKPKTDAPEVSAAELDKTIENLVVE